MKIDPRGSVTGYKMKSKTLFEVFFHATSHERAKDITEPRTDLRKGEKKRDFSDGDGFYLSKHFDDALRCAGQSGKGSAVRVFRLKRTELRGNNDEKCYDLGAPDMKSLENGKKWIGTSGMKS